VQESGNPDTTQNISRSHALRGNAGLDAPRPATINFAQVWFYAAIPVGIDHNNTIAHNRFPVDKKKANERGLEPDECYCFGTLKEVPDIQR